MAALTTKELGSIADALVSEQLKINKAEHYASEVSDPVLKAEFQRERDLHAGHFARLYALL